MSVRVPTVVGVFVGILTCALNLAGADDPASRFEGTWLGKVTAPNATTDIGFAFRQTGKGLLTTFHMPAMGVYSATLGPAEIHDERLDFPPLNTTLTRTADRLVGTFGLSHLALELQRIDGSFAPAPPPPDFPSGPAPVWTVNVGAETWASPVVHENVIYLGTGAGKFHALEASSGRVLWTWTGSNPLYGTALATAETVFFLDAAQQLVALNREKGSLAWIVPLHNAAIAGGPLKPNETYNHRTAVPVLLDGTLYVGSSDGGIYALDPKSGDVRWRHEAKSKLYASAGIDRGELLFAGYDGSVIILSPQTQKEIVRTKLPGPISSTPVVAGDVVIVGCRDYTLYGLRRSDLSIAWKYSYWFSWVESTPALDDGIAYIGGSDYARVTALEPENGRARWSTEVHGLTWGTPLITPDIIYAGTSAQSDAIIRHVGGIVALERRTGAVKWRIAIPLAKGTTRAGCLGSLVLAGENVIAATFDGTITAYPVGH